jgi:UPF0755 protein
MHKKIITPQSKQTNLTKTKNKFKFLFFSLIALVIIGLLAGFSAHTWYTSNLQAPSQSTDVISIEIKEGDTLQNILPELERSGVIKSELALKIYLRLNKRNPNIKVGKYSLPKNKPADEIIQLLEKGVFTSTVKVTLVEGSRTEDIAETINTNMKNSGSKYNFNKQNFLDIVLNPDSYTFSPSIQEFLDQNKPTGKPLRGFLYPDTYFLDSQMTNIEIVEFIVKNFIDKINTHITPNMMYQTDEITNLYDAIVLASIIEKEASYNDNKALISSVFHNRLKYDYVLGADSTIHFITYQTSENLDTELDSPYNSYKHKGLPPTPISNPSIESIIAAINPENTDYFFFFHDDYGNTYYSVTDSEHLSKVCEIRGCY